VRHGFALFTLAQFSDGFVEGTLGLAEAAEGQLPGGRRKDETDLLRLANQLGYGVGHRHDIFVPYGWPRSKSAFS